MLLHDIKKKLSVKSERLQDSVFNSNRNRRNALFQSCVDLHEYTMSSIIMLQTTFLFTIPRVSSLGSLAVFFMFIVIRIPDSFFIFFIKKLHCIRALIVLFKNLLAQQNLNYSYRKFTKDSSICSTVNGRLHIYSSKRWKLTKTTTSCICIQ